MSVPLATFVSCVLFPTGLKYHEGLVHFPLPRPPSIPRAFAMTLKLVSNQLIDTFINEIDTFKLVYKLIYNVVFLVYRKVIQLYT